MRLSLLIAPAIAALALSACASTRAPQTPQQAAADRAHCEDVLKMGTGAEHDHGRDRTGGQGPMAAEHQRCRALLGR